MYRLIVGTTGLAITAGRRIVRELPTGNLAANFAGIFWTNLLSLVAIPVYIWLLGPQEWGLVATCMSLQVIFSLLDTGLSQVMPRWIALAGEDSLPSVVATFRRLYLIAAAAVFLAGQIFAPVIAARLFHAPSHGEQMLLLCLRLILLQLFFQFINNANVGFWNGLQRQKQANWRLCTFATLRFITALSLAMTTHKAWGYAVGCAAAASLECGLNWRAVSDALSRVAGSSRQVPKFEIGTILRESGLTTFAAVLGALVAQMDRLTLATSVPGAQFGVYVVLLNLSASALQLQSPLTKALYPRMAIEASGAGPKGRSFRLLLVGTLGLCVLPCLLGAGATRLILNLWLHNDFFVREGSFALSILLIAAGINATYNVFYAQLLALGWARKIFLINSICFVALAVEAVALRGRFGLLLGCLMVSTNSVIQLTAGILMVAGLYGFRRDRAAE